MILHPLSDLSAYDRRPIDASYSLDTHSEPTPHITHVTMGDNLPIDATAALMAQVQQMQMAFEQQMQQTNAAALAQQQHFQHEVENMRQQQYALQQQLQHAQGALLQAPPQVPQRAPSIRIAAPPTYDGSTPSLEEWVAKMRQQFDFYHFDHDRQRVHAGAASITGPALDWWHQRVADDDAPTTWEAFEDALRSRFQPVTTEIVARNELSSLSQGRSSISVYVAHFRRLIGRIPRMDAASQLFAFEHGLNENLYKQLQAIRPASLKESIDLAVRMGTHSQRGASHNENMDLNGIVGEGGPPTEEQKYPEAAITRSELYALLAANNNRRGNGSGSPGRGAQGASGGFQGPRGLPTITGLTEAQVRKYMEEGRCFACNQTGHRSRECPKRSPSVQGPTGK